MRDGHQFRYSEDQWAKIVPDLPPRALRLDIRRYMEDAISINKTNRAIESKHPVQTLGHKIKAHRRLARAARELVEAYDERVFETIWDRSQPAPTKQLARWRREAIKDRKSLLDGVSKLAEGHEKIVKALVRRKATGRSGPKGDLKQDYLLEGLIAFWIGAGGRVASTVRAKRGEDGSKVDGPLVRFLINASSPVLEKPISRNRARYVIRKVKAGKTHFESIGQAMASGQFAERPAMAKFDS